MKDFNLFTSLKTSRVFPIAIIFLLALAIRMTYLYEIHDNPFFHNLMLDEVSYDKWGQRIAGGEWLGKGVFYQDPLYPYFLGAIYSVVGRDMLSVRIIQIFIGSVTCALIYLLGSSFFNRATGIAAGVIAAFYRPFFYFEAMFLKTFLGAFLFCLFLLLLFAARSRRSFFLWVVAGFTLGMLALVRANTLALAGGVLVWLLAVDWESEDLKRKAIVFAGFMAGLLIVLSSVCIRNYVVGKDIVLLTSQAGQNFYIGNNPGNRTGRYQPPIYIRPNPRYEQVDFRTRAETVAGRKLKPSEASAYWFGEAFRFIRQNPGDWLKLTWTKTRVFWNWYEVPDNQSFYFFSRYSRLLRLPLPGFHLVAALALAGMVLCAPQWRKHLLLYLVVILYSGTVIAYYLFGRYRMPMVPVLILFAAYVVTSIPPMLTQKKYVKLGITGLLTSAFLGFMSMHVNPESYAVDKANGYSRLGDAYQTEKRLNKALDAYKQAIEITPHYWAPYYGLGQVYEQGGKEELALVNYTLARKYNRGNPNICERLGRLHFMKGDFVQSADFYYAALELKPNWVKPHRRLVKIYERLGDSERMQMHMKKLEELEALKKQN